MQPGQLTSESFSRYPPEARTLAVKHVPLFQQLPLAFLPLLLRELNTYDWKFPAERQELDHQFKYLDAQSLTQLAALVSPFNGLKLSAQLENVDWVNVPAQFSEELSAYLWATNQIDAFRKASVDYVHNLNLAQANAAPPVARLCMVLVGRGAAATNPALFRRLRPYGVHFTNVDPTDGTNAFFSALENRVERYPAPFAHWYIDGATLETRHDQWTCVSYDALSPVRAALLDKMGKVMRPGGGGPELLRSELQRMRPEEVGFPAAGNAVLSRFQLSLLTEGSGTQIFSTTFVQWAAREALRRAQPWTMLLRYAPRQKNASIGETLTALDPEGSLVDADMGAYYTWINQQRLQNPTKAGFVAWYEGHNQAIAIGAPFHAGSVETSRITLKQVLSSL
jgi:hypothetical protein